MIEIKNLELKKELKDGIASPNDVTRYLLKNYSSWEIAEALGEILATNATAPARITISAEEFLAHFKVRGYKLNGEPENRGSRGLSANETINDLFKSIKPNGEGKLEGR